MKRRLAVVILGLVVGATGCVLRPHVDDGEDRDRVRRPAVSSTTTTTGEVNCQALGCPGSPPDSAP